METSAGQILLLCEYQSLILCLMRCGDKKKTMHKTSLNKKYFGACRQFSPAK